MARNLTRNTRVFVSTQGTLGSCTLANTWEIKVLDGYDFSQATTTEDITISEAGDTPIRGQKTFNVAQEPVDISLTTYIRPYINDSTAPVIDAPEKVLWASLAGSSITPSVVGGSEGDLTDNTNGNGEAVFQQASGTGMLIDFEESDSNELAKLYIWFHLENTTYRADEVNISTAEIDFAIEGIAQVTWSGMGTSLTELSSANHTVVEGWTADTEYAPVPATSSASFLRNKLSTMKLYQSDNTKALVTDVALGAGQSTTNLEDSDATFTVDAYIGDWLYIVELDDYRQITDNDATNIIVDPAFDSTITAADTYYVLAGYNIAITGGSLTIENNMDFLTPEELGVVNQPLPGFAGSRAVTGSITAYLNTGDNSSSALLADLLADVDSVSNSYNFTLYMGGTSATTKRIDLTMATAQLAIPTVNVEDVIATEITLAGQGSSGAIENQDEVIITYHA